MQWGVREGVNAIWITVWIVWAAGALRGKRTARVQSAGSRLVQMGLVVTAFLLLFTAKLRFGLLAWRFVPESPEVTYTGLVLTLCGAVLAIWARLFLGGNWSSAVTIKQDHKLVRSGPYAAVRHPIYAGFLLALLGTAIAFGEVRGLVAVTLALIGWWLKSRLEEEFLMKEFGAEYAQYKREVKALIPYVL